MGTNVESTDRLAIGREISRALVAALKDSVGRGPTYAQTYVEDTLVVTMFHDTMTAAEHTLEESGDDEAVRDLRRSLEGAFRQEAIGVVEKLTGRSVVAMLSDHAVDPDYSIQAFVLEPGFGDELD
jgi:uncharacterized protein YbcI